MCTGRKGRCESGFAAAGAHASRGYAMICDHRGDQRRPERTRTHEIARRKLRSGRAAQQRMLRAAVRMHDVLAVKNHTQAMGESELFEAEECGTLSETGNRDGLLPPDRIDLV